VAGRQTAILLAIWQIAIAERASTETTDLSVMSQNLVSDYPDSGLTVDEVHHLLETAISKRERSRRSRFQIRRVA
jgi:hypothetical protein